MEHDDTNIDVAAWQSVGSRICNAMADCDDDEITEPEYQLDEPEPECEDDIVEINAYSEKSPGLADCDEVDVAAWKNVGNRFAMALASIDDDEME